MKRLLFLVLALCLLAATAAGETLEMYTGITVSKDATVLDLQDKNIVNMERLMGYLDQLPRLQKVDMFGSRLSMDQLYKLQARYPGVTFGVNFGYVKKAVSTLQTAFSTMQTPEDQRYGHARFDHLQLMPHLLAMDLGHNAISDLSFLLKAPQLKVLILADNYITDLTPLAKLHDLEYLELFSNKFTDLTPLAGLSKLKDLNICYNKIDDVTPLLGLTQLERLWLPDRFLTAEQKAQLEAALPNTHILYEWSRSTSFGWRHHPRYTVIRKMFETGVYAPFPEDVPAVETANP